MAFLNEANGVPSRKSMVVHLGCLKKIIGDSLKEVSEYSLRQSMGHLKEIDGDSSRNSMVVQ